MNHFKFYTIMLFICVLIFGIPGQSLSKSGDIIFSSQGLKITEAQGLQLLNTESVSLSPPAIIQINSADPFNEIRSHVLPGLMDKAVTGLFDELTTGSLKSEIEAEDQIESVSVNAEEQVITIHLKNMTLDKDEEDTSLCKLSYAVKLKNGRLKLKLADLSTSVSVSDENQFYSRYSLPSSYLEGNLYVWAKCGVLKLIEKEPPIKINGIRMSFTTAMDYSVDDGFKVKEVSNIDLDLTSVEIDADEMGWIKEKIFEYGLETFIDGECKSKEDFEECISRVALKSIGKLKITNALTEMISDALPETFDDLTDLEQSETASGITVTASAMPTNITLSPSNPNVLINFETQLKYSFQKDSCADNLLAPGTSVSLNRRESSGGEADIIFPKSVVENLMYAYLKTGVLCVIASYTDPTTGITLSGPLEFDGSMTLSKGAYEAPLYVWDNSVNYFKTDTEESALTIAPLNGIQIKKDLKSTIMFSDGYELNITSYTEDAIIVSIPVTWNGVQSGGGATVSVSFSGNLLVYGVIEPDEKNVLNFNIKVVNVADVKTEVSEGMTPPEAAEVEEGINAQLNKMYYSSKTKIITYHDCNYSNLGDDEMPGSAFGIHTSMSENNCDENCQIPTGMKVTNLSLYDYFLNHDTTILSPHTFTIGFNTAEDSYPSDAGCGNIKKIPGEFYSQLAEDSKKMQEIDHLITEAAAQEGVRQVDQTLAWLESLMSKIKDMAIINEKPYPEEELSQYLQFFDSFKLQTDLTRMNNHLNKIDRNIQNFRLQK